MDRQRLLVVVVLSGAGLWLTLQLFVDPWWGEMKKLRQDVEKARGQIAAMKETIDRGPAWNAKWRKLNERLSRERESDTLSQFVMGVGKLCTDAGVQDLSTKTGREQKLGERGEFVEYAVETTFKAGWPAFVELLKAVKKEKEFLRVQRLAVTSKEKESRVDVEMRVSTIELAARGGGK